MFLVLTARSKTDQALIMTFLDFIAQSIQSRRVCGVADFDGAELKRRGSSEVGRPRITRFPYGPKAPLFEPN